MIVVSNTSPLIAFAKIDRFDLLQALFSSILIPSSVREEFRRHATREEQDRFAHASQTFIQATNPITSIGFTRRLGTGEQDVITIAVEKKADLVLIDDRKGRNEAAEHQLNVASTRAILIVAEKRGLLDSYHKIESLLKTQFFFPPEY